MSTPEALRLADNLETPGRMFSCDAVAAELRRQHAQLERLTAERDAIRALLPDVYFPGSKDWTQGGLAQRVDCLKTWLADAQAEASAAHLAFEQVTAERDGLRLTVAALRRQHAELERLTALLDEARAALAACLSQLECHETDRVNGEPQCMRDARAALQQPKEQKA